MCNIFFNLVHFFSLLSLSLSFISLFPFNSLYSLEYIYIFKKLYCYPGRNGSTLSSYTNTCCTHWDLQQLIAGSPRQLSGMTGKDSGQCELLPSQASQSSPVPPHFLNSTLWKEQYMFSEWTKSLIYIHYIINRLINFVYSAYIFVDAAVYFLIFCICFCALD